MYFGVEYSSQKGTVFGFSWQVGNYGPPCLSGTESDRDGAVLCPWSGIPCYLLWSRRAVHNILVFNIMALFPRL